jgi:hypothetical protein
MKTIGCCRTLGLLAIMEQLLYKAFKRHNNHSVTLPNVLKRITIRKSKNLFWN